MNQNATPGTNRTGIAAAPQRTQEMLAGMDEFPPSAPGSAEDLAQVRISYAKAAEPLGSVPLPADVKGKGTSAAKATKGVQPLLLTDKLGERLAFERTGTRLYEALVSKHEAFGSFAGGPSREDLAQIQQEEFQHFTLLQSVIKQLGGDPTAVTPSADLHATAAHGIQMVIVDPRTTLLQSLEAIPDRRAGRQCLLGGTHCTRPAGGGRGPRVAVRARPDGGAGAPPEGAGLARGRPGVHIAWEA